MTSGNMPIQSGQWIVTLSATSGTLYSDQYCTQPITGAITLNSGASTSFYYIATATGTPTITAQATPNYAPVSTTFTINNPTSITPLSSSTGFDDASNWALGWDTWANPPWTGTTDSTHVVSAPRSATSVRSNQGAFSSNPMDATGAKYITVSFEYMVYQTSSSDFQIRYSGTTATEYMSDMWTILGANGATLGSATGGTSAYTPGGTRHQYTATITDPAAFTTYFRLSFMSQDFDSRSQVWVDNVVITIYK
ncbi:MAG: hypothetical protein M1540_01010 [Candidatus Bathyarchaeota archaeon]|nr:hypothetical protein [Candidatus Bathyarchaeota archaeon]